MNHLLPSLCLVLFTLCAAANAAQTPKEHAVERAKEAAHRFHTMMKSNLKPEIKAGGFLAGATYCAEKSHAKIAELNDALGPELSIKRISLANRNLDAFPSKEEADIVRALDLIETSDAYLPEAIVQMVDESTYKVYLPATMSRRNCKKCHGKSDEMDPKARAYIREHYPKDKATGFRSGQVRGAVVVTVRSGLDTAPSQTTKEHP